jgi:hypothetical protein
MRSLRLPIALMVLLILCACSTTRESLPARTATEQLLLSTAADRAAQQLRLNLAPNTKVFLDVGNFEGYDQKYALSAIKDRLLLQRLDVVPDKSVAEVILEVRSGALSIDENKKLWLGIPSFAVPLPLSNNSLTLPELALFRRDIQQGIAKFAISGYDQAGVFRASVGPVYGTSNRIHWVVLLVGWTTNDAVPEGVR